MNNGTGPDGRTIYTIYNQNRLAPEAQPGIDVSVTGTFQKGLIYPNSIRVIGGSPWPQPNVPAQPTGQIDHIIFLFQENHTYDNYFGTFTGGEGFPPNLLVPERPGQTPAIAPFHFTQPLLHDLPHEWENALAAVNGGNMDGFIRTEGSIDTMGYYDESDIPNYWAYARQFLLMDHFFSSTLAPSLPNHLYSVSGQSGGIVRNLDRPPEEGFEFDELAEFLQDSQISWKYYDGKENPKAYSLWNPLPGFQDFAQNPDLMSHLVSVQEYYRDLRDGTLPAVSWIVPNMVESEHPPSNIQLGMWYATDLINALMKSPYWQNTALLLTWDDYGGFYDHLLPPRLDELGFGLRVPAILISSYVKSGKIDKSVYEFASWLKFVEMRFNIQPMTERDQNALDLGQNLDLKQKPLEPFIIARPSK